MASSLSTSTARSPGSAAADTGRRTSSFDAGHEEQGHHACCACGPSTLAQAGTTPARCCLAAVQVRGLLAMLEARNGGGASTATPTMPAPQALDAAKNRTQHKLEALTTAVQVFKVKVVISVPSGLENV